MKHIIDDLFIGKLSLLKGLNSIQIEEFLKYASVKTASKGEVIFSQADSNRLFFLHSGIIKLVEVKENGFEIVKDMLGENDMFGESSFDIQNSHCEYAKALSPRVILVTIDRNRFKHILAENPILSFNFYQNLIQKINRLENRCISLSTIDNHERLRQFLLEMGTRENISSDGRIVFRNYLTQDEIAKMIFVSRQTLSRLLRDLRQAGELRYSRGKIEINSLSHRSQRIPTV